jgi:ribonuclease HI
MWTDGSVQKQHGPGGYGVVIRSGSYYNETSGGMGSATSQRMELVAAYEGIRFVESLSRSGGVQQIEVRSDSKYLVEQIYSPKVLRLYQDGSLHTIANGDMWDKLLQLRQFHNIEWIKVPGHAGIEENERAHELAREAVESIVEKTRLEKEKEQKDVDHGRSLYRYIVEKGIEDPAKVTATNPRNKRREEAKLLNVLGPDAHVLFSTTITKKALWQGYGKQGNQSKYPPMDVVSIWDVQPIKEWE